MISGDQSRGDLPLAVKFRRCANGEMLEFYLAMDGQQVSRGIFRTVYPGESIPLHALAALREVLRS